MIHLRMYKIQNTRSNPESNSVMTGYRSCIYIYIDYSIYRHDQIVYGSGKDFTKHFGPHSHLKK